MRKLIAIAGFGLAGAVVGLVVLVRPAHISPRHAQQTRNDPASRAGVADEPAPIAVPALRDEPELVAYLDSLEAEARQAGAVHPDLARRGFAAIRQLEPSIGHDRAFARGIALGHRLRWLRRELELAPTQQQLAELRTQLASANDRAARARLNLEYRNLAAELPEPYRQEALARLTPRATAATRTP